MVYLGLRMGGWYPPEKDERERDLGCGEHSWKFLRIFAALLGSIAAMFDVFKRILGCFASFFV